MTKISFKESIGKLKEAWQPQDLFYVNDTAFRMAKIDGAYRWHTHQSEDEFFLVIKGKVFIDLDNQSIELKEGDGYLVKQGTRHRSRSDKPSYVLLVEPIKTKTKGDDS